MFRAPIFRNMSKLRNNAEAQARMFKALGNPHRLAVFQQLMTCCKPGTACDAEAAARACVGSLGKDLDIALSTLSHHLKELKQAGLIQTQRRGQQVECWVEPAVLEALSAYFSTPLKITESP